MAQHHGFRAQPGKHFFSPCRKIIVALIRKDEHIHALRVCLCRVQRETSQDQEFFVLRFHVKCHDLAGFFEDTVGPVQERKVPHIADHPQRTQGVQDMSVLKLDMSPLQDADADEARLSRRGMFLTVQVIGLSHPDLHHIARLLQEILHCAAALPGTEQRIVMLSLPDQFFCLIQMVEMTVCHEDRIILQKFLG